MTYNCGKVWLANLFNITTQKRIYYLSADTVQVQVPVYLVLKREQTNYRVTLSIVDSFVALINLELYKMICIEKYTILSKIGESISFLGRGQITLIARNAFDSGIM